MLGIAMYLATLEGTPVRTIAASIGMPMAWVAERIEAGRLCIEHQISSIEIHVVD
jgi:hypothetical protein